MQPPLSFATRRTPAGHLCGEAASALQKAIRRCEEREALYWATELELAGYGNYVFKRLRIIASEDVGLADNSAAVLVRTLYDNYSEAVRTTRPDDTRPGQKGRIFLVHAVLALARAPKSRIVDHALMVSYRGERTPLDVPDHALDHHTAAGKKKRRGMRFFFDTSSRLVNEQLNDDYRAEARRICVDEGR